MGNIYRTFIEFVELNHIQITIQCPWGVNTNTSRGFINEVIEILPNF
jgi:hypothetical protein